MFLTIQAYQMLSLAIVFFTTVNAFLPATVETNIINVLGSIDRAIIGRTSDTISHEQILQRGITRSVARYFYNQPGGSSKINQSQIDSGAYDSDIRLVYQAYYGKWYCVLDVDTLLTTVMQPYIASVDIDTTTMKLPYAHFDGETFNGSNQRVIDYTSQVYSALASKNYAQARILAAQVMHTIQDFYSHSNWVEMGNTGINTLIGNASML
jgi:hypothetical protein